MPALIRLRGVTKRYDDSTQPALDDFIQRLQPLVRLPAPPST